MTKAIIYIGQSIGTHTVLLALLLQSYSPWSAETERALKLAGENRAEMEMVPLQLWGESGVVVSTTVSRSSDCFQLRKETGKMISISWPWQD